VRRHNWSKPKGRACRQKPRNLAVFCRFRWNRGGLQRPGDGQVPIPRRCRRFVSEGRETKTYNLWGEKGCGGGHLVQGLLATAEKWLEITVAHSRKMAQEEDEEDGPWERAPARLPSPVLVRLVGAAVRLAGELRLDVGALLLLVPGPRGSPRPSPIRKPTAPNIHVLHLRLVSARREERLRLVERGGEVLEVEHEDEGDEGQRERFPVLIGTRFFTASRIARFEPRRRGRDRDRLI
jgi:hypothetical protein